MGEIYTICCQNFKEENNHELKFYMRENREFRKSQILEQKDSIKQTEINDNEEFNTNENEYINENLNEKKKNKILNNNFIDNYENADMDKLLFINKMISSPEDLQREASKRLNDINVYFEKRIEEKENNDFVNVLNMDKNLRILILNYFLDKKNNDKQNSKKEKDIENIISQNNKNKKITIKLFLQIICDINDSVEENVWKVLEENPNNVYDILKKYEEIVIVTIPLNEKKIITYYFFYNFN